MQELFGGHWTDSGSYIEVPNLSGLLNLVNGTVFSMGTFFVGGDRPEHLYTLPTNPLAPSHKVSFIHNFDPSGNILS